MTKDISIFRAQPIGDQTIEPVTIKIIDEIPTRRIKSLDEMGAVYEKEAEELANALWNSLPGGTIDRLFIKLCQRKASLLAISYRPKDDEGNGRREEVVNDSLS